jgi:hypothetical protein
VCWASEHQADAKQRDAAQFLCQGSPRSIGGKAASPLALLGGEGRATDAEGAPKGEAEDALADAEGAVLAGAFSR